MEQLAIVSAMFDALDAERVEYLHWKSNEHLAAALRGETDLDLLVSNEDDGRFRAIVDRFGFVEMQLPAVRRIDGVSGFLGYDDASGMLVHLDVYHALILGEQLIKNHHLPIEDWLQTDSDELEGVRIPSAARELVILYVRAMLKTTVRQLVRAARLRRSPLPERIMREASWLAGRVDSPELVEAASSSGLGISADEILEFHSRALQHRFDWRYVAQQRRSLRRQLRRYERSSRWRAFPRKLNLRLRSSRPVRRIGLGIGPRRLVGSAPLIAVVGADGSGKTRLTADLTEWLSRKLVVHHVYFGQPKTTTPFRVVNKAAKLVSGRPADGGDPARKATARARAGGYLSDAKWVVLARRRRRLAAEARAACGAGEVVIAERFPLEEFHSMDTPMDGPRLARAEGSVSTSLARAEARSYDSIDRPDLVLALSTDVETLQARKLDLTLEEYIAKAAAIDALAPGPGLVVIDAGQPYDDVLSEVKAAVWRTLRADN